MVNDLRYNLHHIKTIPSVAVGTVPLQSQKRFGLTFAQFYFKVFFIKPDILRNMKTILVLHQQLQIKCYT